MAGKQGLRAARRPEYQRKLGEPCRSRGVRAAAALALSDPSYWNRYLPRVAIIWVVFFIGLPVLIGHW